MSDSAKVMRVNMLGEFSIYYNGEPIRLENNYSTKAMKALQLLLYRGEQGILRDSLLDTLFSGDSTSDPVNNLKVTLSNLRRLLAKVGLPPEVTVQSHNKRYSFVCPGGIDLDVWEFERLLGKAAASEHEEERREYLLQAADLYKGDFLPHLSGEDWVLVTAAKYRQQYFGCVQDLAALLGRREEWERLYAIATHAAALHHLEEWQCLRIDCLMKLEQYRKAKEVYDQAVRELEEDFVAKPSAELVKRFQMLSLAGDEKRETVTQLTNQLQEETRGRGAYYCSYPSFIDVYRMCCRMIERSGQSAYLLLYWLTDSRNNTLEDNQKIAGATPSPSTAGTGFWCCSSAPTGKTASWCTGASPSGTKRTPPGAYPSPTRCTSPGIPLWIFRTAGSGGPPTAPPDTWLFHCFGAFPRQCFLSAFFGFSVQVSSKSMKFFHCKAIILN